MFNVTGLSGNTREGMNEDQILIEMGRDYLERDSATNQSQTLHKKFMWSFNYHKNLVLEIFNQVTNVNWDE